MKEIVEPLREKGINIVQLQTNPESEDRKDREDREVYLLNQGQYAASLRYKKMGVDFDLFQNERFDEGIDSYEWVLILNEFFPIGVYHQIQKFLEDILIGK